jgi:DNA-binding NarL/FixJ family response regulator
VIRVVIAEDQTLMRELLGSLLGCAPGIELVGVAPDGRSLMDLVRAHAPDLVLTDIVLPDLNGIDATRAICADYPGTKVLVISGHTERQIVAEAFRAGASGFLSKSCAREEVVHAVAVVAGGEAYMTPVLAGQLVRDLAFAPSPNGGSAWTSLSTREREVLQLISEGKSTKEIAEALGVSVKTVETHRQQVLSKLGLKSTADLVKYAIREGLTSLDF